MFQTTKQMVYRPRHFQTHILMVKMPKNHLRHPAVCLTSYQLSPVAAPPQRGQMKVLGVMGFKGNLR